MLLHTLDVGNSHFIADDEVIAQLPEAFLVICDRDTLCNDILIYKKHLEDLVLCGRWLPQMH
jgi:hypothetical protein